MIASERSTVGNLGRDTRREQTTTQIVALQIGLGFGSIAKLLADSLNTEKMWGLSVLPKDRILKKSCFPVRLFPVTWDTEMGGQGVFILSSQR